VRNAIGVVLAVVVLGVFVYVWATGGVRVEVENVGAEAITDVVVKVSGDERDLGDIAPGSTEAVKVAPKGTTKRVEVTWRSGDRDGYGKVEVVFEDSGYKGTVRFAIDGISVKEAAEDLDTGFF